MTVITETSAFCKIIGEKGNNMLRNLLLTISGLAFAVGAHAGEAGRVIFVAGKASVAERSVAEGMMVQEGEMLRTGGDGFIYIKTIDNGLFILRPNTEARIVAYHVDVKEPANTRIKLELLSGVARSKSGDAVKLARQNFRFNTPVAAIGVRGTDFTVFTTKDTSRVAVISGGVIVSGFVGACSPAGNGPCEGSTSRELSAAQRGQLLQVQRDQLAPQLLQGGASSPDQVSPPRADEPLAKNGLASGANLATGEPNLDAKKNDSLSVALPQRPPVVGMPAPPPVVVQPAPPVVTPPLPPVLPPAVVESGIVWGRWQPLMDKPATVDLLTQKVISELLAIDGNFALFRTAGREYVAPLNGTVGFALKDSEAYIYSDYAGVFRRVDAATLGNGKLNIDFGSKQFTTSMDLSSNDEVIKLQGQGAVAGDGRLYGDASNGRPGYIDVKGLLSKDQGGSAAYIFSGRLDSLRTVNGVTSWH